MTSEEETLKLAGEIKAHLQEVSSSLEGEFVVIGGWAVHAWGRRDYSLDGDAMVSFEALGTLRDEYCVTPNPRMHKQQYQLRGFDVDLYVEHAHKLPVSFDELRLKATEKEGMWVASPEHLLILKCAAAKDRQASPKGFKDRQDLVQLIDIIQEQKAVDCEALNKYLGETELETIKLALDDQEVFQELAGRNSHQAKVLRASALKAWDDIFTQCQLAQEGPEV